MNNYPKYLKSFKMYKSICMPMFIMSQNYYLSTNLPIWNYFQKNNTSYLVFCLPDEFVSKLFEQNEKLIKQIFKQ